MRLENKMKILKKQQLSDGSSGGRVGPKDLTVITPLVKDRLPVISLQEDKTNIKNIKGSIYHINRLSPFLT